MGEHFSILPISNWTEMDIWQYIKRENIALPNLYFAHERDVLERNGVLLGYDENVHTLKPGDTVEKRMIRFRTIGDISITGASESTADNLDKIIAEVAAARVTERAGRADDKRSDSAMEDRKKEGYF